MLGRLGGSIFRFFYNMRLFYIVLPCEFTSPPPNFGHAVAARLVGLAHVCKRRGQWFCEYFASKFCLARFAGRIFVFAHVGSPRGPFGDCAVGSNLAFRTLEPERRSGPFAANFASHFCQRPTKLVGRASSFGAIAGTQIPHCGRTNERIGARGL